MCCLAEVLDHDLLHGDQRGDDLRLHTRVDHQSRGYSIKHAGFDQIRLTTTRFFGGCANQQDLARQGRPDFLERECRTDGAGADDVVAAAVTDAGQCVELGNKSQRRTWPTTIPADERCGQSTDAALDRKAALLQALAEPRRGLMFLEGDLRMRMNAQTEVFEVRSEPVARALQVCLECLQVDLRKRGHWRCGPFRCQRRNRGLSRSPNQSPIKLTDRTVRLIATPGNVATHQALPR